MGDSIKVNLWSDPEQVGDTEAKAHGQEMNQMATYIMECGGMERIEHLQMHDNNNIYTKVQPRRVDKRSNLPSPIIHFPVLVFGPESEATLACTLVTNGEMFKRPLLDLMAQLSSTLRLLLSVSQALKLLERYFGVDDDEDNGIAPVATEDAQQFAFGALPQPPQGGDGFGAAPSGQGFNFG